jgi:glutamyl/glutaminyl-tRNA synthetase
MPEVITRFAPSPTGHLHIGGARTALFCWAFARRAGKEGRFIVRIEDTDQARSSDSSARGILEDLAWLGINWDEGPELRADNDAATSRVIGGDPRGVGPFFQARRVALYNTYVDRLLAAGRAYPAFETPEEIDALRKAAAAGKQTYRYDRSRIPMEERLRRMAAGEPHAVRFVAPAEAVTIHDRVLGDVTYAAGEMDDFVIRKADGFPTYHFAVVVDDEVMGVTHVLRAQEHLNNTPRHVALQLALGFRTPVYAHMPLIFNMDGSKMSKRDKAKAARKAAKALLAAPPTTAPMHTPQGAGVAHALKDLRATTPAALAKESGISEADLASFLAGENDSLDTAEQLARFMGLSLPEIEVHDFRAAGYLPEAIVNFLALLGWNPGMKTPDGKDLEKFDIDFLARNFSIERIGRANAKFDRMKLLSFNADAIAALSDTEFVRRWREWCREFRPQMIARLDERTMLMLAPAIKPRARILSDATSALEFTLVADDVVEYQPKSVEKALRTGTPNGLSLLPALREALATVEPFDPATINAAVERFAVSHGIGMGQAAQPLRVALTGGMVSPPLGETLTVLGRASVLARLDRCLRVHSTNV